MLKTPDQLRADRAAAGTRLLALLDVLTERTLAELAVKIDAANRAGNNSITELTHSAAVVGRLEATGYTVKYRPACGMGDIDSHEISW